jgi:predicted ribosome quality control (RQC) complex YloA/Tae2 family protein
MNLATIEQIIPELRDALIGRRPGKIFLLSRCSLVIDFRLTDSQYLFISIEPADPRVYLIRRRRRDLEKASVNPSAFVMQMKKRFSGSEIDRIEQIDGERALAIGLAGTDELGSQFTAALIVQLTGKSANLFLTDQTDRIVDSLRDTLGEGQQIGDFYHPPQRTGIAKPGELRSIDEGETLSEILDAEDLERRSDVEFRSIVTAVRSKTSREIARLEKLKTRLLGDLESHGDAERWKRFGDLLLANIGTAKRSGSRVRVIDYFDDATPTIEIDVDENDELTKAAEKFFKRYTKARNARDEIAKRLETTDLSLGSLNAELASIEKEIADRDVELLRERLGPQPHVMDKRSREKVSATSSVARTFISSDGFEILVGKRAKDNDQLTLKIAKSLDTWMHAADYPGSHVVIRNRDRKEIPPGTLLEAAQLAAFYSQGKAQPKAAVHYTLKKFVNKPKGAAPGLVSLASFKTLLVEPIFPESVVKKE